MTAQEVQRVIGRYELGQILSIQPLGNAGGFSGARLWKVVCDRGVFCLRRWPTNPDVDVRYIHQVLQCAEQAGIPVAAPILSREKRSLIRDSRGMDWELSHWITGAADFNKGPSKFRLHAATQALAQFHQRTADRRWNAQSGALQFRVERLSVTPSLLSQLQTLMGRSENTVDGVGGELLLQLGHAVSPLRKMMERFAVQDWPMVNAIRDIHHDHLFFEGERLTGIVDFGALRVEARCFDLARMVGSLCWNGEHPWEEALAIYAEIEPISVSEIKLIHALHECNVLLGIVNWLDWIYLEKRQFEDWDAVKKRINWLVSEFTG